MLKLLKRVINILAYTGAGIVILLAVLVGLFRLFLPRLTEYQEDIKSWATTAIGMQVDFDGMNARWRLSGPELNFYEAELTVPGAAEALIEASEVTIGVGLLRLLIDRTLVVDRVLVRDTELEFSQTEDGDFLVQGLTPDELAGMVPTSGEAGDVVFIGRDISVRYRDAGQDARVAFAIEVVEARRRDDRLAIEASVDLDEGFGSGLDVSIDRLSGGDSGGSTWQVYLDGRGLGLDRWSAYAPAGLAPVETGVGDISLWLEIANDGIDKATANVAITDLGIADSAASDPFDIAGRIEYSRVDDSLLVAAENLTLRTANGRWPQSSVQVQLLRNEAGDLDEVSANASYIRLEDIRYLSPWLTAKPRSLLDDYAPDGELSNLRLNLAAMQSGKLKFDLAADADGAGIGAVGSFPGIRGFTGGIRADSAGGRVEFQSSGLRVELPDYLSEAVILDDAVGTVIWRRSGESLTVLTDRLHLRSTDFDSRTSLQISVDSAESAPLIDLDSRWSINDVAAAKRYLPEPIINPALYRWLTDALVSGSMNNGTTRLVGPLDKFPFDGGEGRFEVRARMEDAVLAFARGWPEAAIRSMDISLDGMRLATERNLAVTAGNRAVDARVEIADLRKPILTIDAFANGTLESIRQFALQSPIASLFGGRLETVRVTGDASFNLDLTYPITDKQNYDFRARMQTSNGSVELLGFPAAVSELNGLVDISRRTIASESLFGTFLDQPVSIDLRSAAEDSPYSVIADARGRATVEGLVDGLGAPLAGVATGAADYATTIRFPRGGLDEPAPVQIAVSSDLRGLDIPLPAPLSKPREQAVPLSLLIEFPEDRRIAASGSLGDDLRFSTDFVRDDYGWDFDRGALAFGGDYPSVAESRGLHIQGQTPLLRFSDWLGVGRSQSGDGPRFVDRIRSIDLTIDDLYLFGQHLVDHRVIVDRSGLEWFVQANGADVSGTATIPYEFSGSRPIMLDMDRLILPGDEETEEEDADVARLDPRNLPPISVRAEEFAFGDRFIGKVVADFEKTGNGLRATDIRAEDDSFTIEGSAAWLIYPPEGSASSTSVTATLRSRNVERTLARLAYEPVIESNRMTVDIDVRWPGGPRADFLGQLSGDVAVSLGQGQLKDVEPGAGRVFGLLSVVELPRRLSLDFRDVFDRGFGFDEIKGSFRIDTGDAYTCDLSLKGPAADIGIIGRVGLGEGVYEQTAIVSANVGNTLPVVGAVVAGPQVAAALLIFSQIFKKPLQEMGQAYYAIEGQFDDPSIEAADAQRFAATGEKTRCVANVE